MTRGIRFVYRSKRRLTLAGVLIVALATSLTAVAYWTTSGTGAGSASSGTLTAPGKPSVPTTGATVNLSWSAATVSGGGTVNYHVERRPDPGATWTDVCGSTDAAPISSTSCNDTPGNGTFVYRVTSRYASWHTTGAESDPVTVNGDTTPPYVLSINRADSNPTNAGTVNWTVTFSESVTGVDTTDFTVARTGGVTGGSVTGVTGSGTTRTVIATSGTGDGTLGLDLVDDNSIADGASNPLGDSVGGANGNFTGQVYSIDKTNPSVTVNQKAGQADPTNTLPILYTVTFSESVTGFDASDLTRGGTATGGSVAVTGSGASYEIAVTDPGSNLTTGTISFTIGANKAQDAAGNNNTGSSSTDNTVTYDTVSPSTTIALSPASPDGSNGWYKTTTTFTLSASDLGSGIATTKYQIDGGAVTTYPGSAVPITEGQHTISYWSVDTAGNTETTHTTATIKVDTVNPVTTITITPSSNDGSNGWYKTTPTFTLSASDTGGSGIASTFYKIDSGTTETYAGSAVSIPNGQHTISYWSVDIAGNTESTHTTGTIKVDTVAPVTALATTPGTPDGTNNWFKRSSVTFTLSETEATSGVASTLYTIDGGGQQTYSGTVTVSSQGDHTVTFWSVDNAGNVETTNTTHIKLDNVSPGLTLTLAAGPVGAALTGTTVSYKGNAVGSFKFVATVTDTGGSGAVSATFPSIATTSWTHNGETVTGASPYTSTTFSWTANPTNPTGYTITATDQAGNTTAPAVTFTVDTTGPTNNLSLTSRSGGGSFLTGGTVYYQGSLAGQFKIQNALTDGGSGPASSTFAALGGTTTNWTHTTPDVQTTPAGGPYVSNAFSWLTSTSSAPTEVVTGADNVGNTAAATLTFTSDSAVPTAGAVSVNTTAATSGGSSSVTTNTGFPIGSRTDYSDAGSGLASSTLTVQSETFNGSTCGAAGSGGPFTSPTTISGTTQPGGIQAGFCYLYTLTGTDNVGNTASVKTTVTVGLNYTFVVANPGTQTAGTAFGGSTVQLRLNGVDTTTFYGAAYTGSKTITFSGPALSPSGAAPSYPATLTFTNGLATLPAASVTLKKAESTTLTATDATTSPSITGASTSFTVNASAAARLAWTNITTNSPGTPSPNPCYFTCTYASGFANNNTWNVNVSITDSLGNVVSGVGAGHNVTVTLGGSSNGTINNGTTPVTLIIPVSGAATSTTQLAYKAGVGNSWTDTLPAASTGFTSATASFSK